MLVDGGNESMGDLHDVLLFSPQVAKGGGRCPRRDGLGLGGLSVASFALPHPCGVVESSLGWRRAGVGINKGLGMFF